MLKPKKMIFFIKWAKESLLSKVKVWIQDLEWVRTKVSLEGEGLSFGEIYMNGRTLDLSGLTLNFDQIKTNSNNVFITSFQSGTHLNLENKQDYLYHGNIFSDEAVTMSANTDKALIFDGNIYNKEGVFRTENAKLNFQGHARIHAYVSKEQAKKLQEHGLSALTKPVSFTQEDWVFVLKELNLEKKRVLFRA